MAPNHKYNYFLEKEIANSFLRAGTFLNMTPGSPNSRPGNKPGQKLSPRQQAEARGKATVERLSKLKPNERAKALKAALEADLAAKAKALEKNYHNALDGKKSFKPKIWIILQVC